MFHTDLSHTASRVSPPMPEDELGRMVRFMRHHGAATLDDLRREFSEQAIDKHSLVAAAMASRMEVRDVGTDPADHNEQARLYVEKQQPHTPESGARIVAGMIPQMAMVTTRLREEGWTNTEIATHLPDICALAGDELADMGARYFGDIHGGDAGVGSEATNGGIQ